ncbi:MAG: hypothetical protein IPN70_01635 [Candidatus Moraniibacteriota bacterium]|nr:MAG: hypothetical protein IPN70_01635 [Candidatus Moranbacteria bacterium]
MVLQIQLTSHLAQLFLIEKEKKIKEHSFPIDTDLSKKLLIEIDAFLKESHRDPFSLERVECVCDSAGFTTERIGETITNTYNFILEMKKSKLHEKENI